MGAAPWMNSDNILKMKETDTGGHKCWELFKTGKYVELENRSERLFRAGCVGVRLEYLLMTTEVCCRVAELS